MPAGPGPARRGRSAAEWAFCRVVRPVSPCCPPGARRRCRLGGGRGGLRGASARCSAGCVLRRSRLRGRSLGGRQPSVRQSSVCGLGSRPWCGAFGAAVFGVATSLRVGLGAAALAARVVSGAAVVTLVAVPSLARAAASAGALRGCRLGRRLRGAGHADRSIDDRAGLERRGPHPGPGPVTAVGEAAVDRADQLGVGLQRVADRLDREVAGELGDLRRQFGDEFLGLGGHLAGERLESTRRPRRRSSARARTSSAADSGDLAEVVDQLLRLVGQLTDGLLRLARQVDGRLLRLRRRARSRPAGPSRIVWWRCPRPSRGSRWPICCALPT